MLTRTFTYEDFDGNQRTETCCFHLTKAELTEMNTFYSGGLEKMLRRVAEEKDVQKIVEILKDVILRSYGKKSEDGRRFIKSQELRDEFSQTEVYSMLFMELANDANAAAAFANGIIAKATPNQKPKLAK